MKWYMGGHKDTFLGNARGSQLYSTTPSLSAENATKLDNASSQPSPLLETTRHLPRLYVATAPNSFTPNSLVPITSAQTHYLLDVMRITNPKRWQELAGHVRIFNGHDGEWLAKVMVSIGEGTTPSRKRQQRKSNENDGTGTVLECVERLAPQPFISSSSINSNGVYMHLYMGRLKKKQHRKWVLEKVTELGVDSISMMDTEYSVGAGGDPWEYEKHQSHVIEAAEQCERLTLPTMPSEPLVWDGILEKIRQSNKGNDDDDKSQHVWLVCRERSVNSPPIVSALQAILWESRLANETKKRNIHFHILVGPEGGWSPTEMDTFSDLVSKKQQRQPELLNVVQFVSLGSLVLRAETAAITAVGIIGLTAQCSSSLCPSCIVE